MSNLVLQNVTKAFHGVLAVNRLSLEFEKGKVYALIGANGAGKTTVFNLISSLLCPTKGNIYYNDIKLSGLKPWHVAQLGIGRLFQDVRVFDRLTLLENILTAFKGQRGENTLVSVFRRGLMRREEERLRERAEDLLERIGLKERADELAVNLSYGQQKLLSLMRLLAAEMEVLLLDEPTAGLNPQMICKIPALVRKASAEGKTVIIIEHNMSVVSECVNTVFFMNNGRMIFAGSPAVTLNRPEVKAAYLGI